MDPTVEPCDEVVVTRDGLRTSRALRERIRASDESTRALARRLGLDRRTVAKWRARASIEDEPRGPKTKGPRALSLGDEAIIVAFRRLTLLSLDDCHYALKAAIPYLTRSSLQRCLVRNGLNRLDQIRGLGDRVTPEGLGYVFVNAMPITTAEGLIYFYSAFDPASKLIYSRGYAEMDAAAAAAFLEDLVDCWPYQVRKVTTEDDPIFISPGAGPRSRGASAPFARACATLGVGHDVVPRAALWPIDTDQPLWPCPPNAPRQRSRSATREGSVAYMQRWIRLYTFKVRLKALRGLTPYAHLRRLWTASPSDFKCDPCRLETDPPANTDRPPPADYRMIG